VFFGSKGGKEVHREEGGEMGPSLLGNSHSDILFYVRRGMIYKWRSVQTERESWSVQKAKVKKK